MKPTLRNASQLQAAIIDLDGTLVDTLGDFVEALNRTLAELHLPALGRAQVERMIGKGSENLLLSAMAHLGEPDPAARLPVAWAAYQRHYLHVNGRFSQVFDGALAGLQALRDAGLPLACVTNKPLAFAQPLLHDKGLAGFFSHVFGGDSFERKKPDPLPLLKTCEALGTAPARTLMVGDSQNDGLAARAAGCPVVLVTYGYNHGEPIAEAPHDALVDSLAQLSEWPGLANVQRA
ncbi:phosphoglycolate phosphatase [Hydrogenophaga atypica]|uniref:Phosphoglycolate phosphatase n=1 Tax=Hydrogenophaga atypica TaxID=249409 RepID=A0ABW2QNW0_9BURK